MAAPAVGRARDAFEADWPRYLAVGVSAAICREAGVLAERYRLRGYDSVHLACYLEIARAVGAAGIQFSSFDDRLNRAARAAVRTLRTAKS